MNKERPISTYIMGMDDYEIKMIKLIADGFTHIEIGEKLNLKTSKVLNLRKNLISKTRTKNIASLISFAYKYGILKV